MNAVYFFDENGNIDYNLKSYLNSFGVELDYETRLSNFLTKVVVLKPGIVFIDPNLPSLKFFIEGLFHKNSPFYVPLVICLQDDKKDTIRIDLENFLSLKMSDKAKVLPELFEMAEIKRKNYMQKVLYPFTKFDDVTNILLKVGFAIKNRGTIYLKDCITTYLNDIGKFSYSVGKVFPTIASQHATNIANIERCIRITIDNVWKNIDTEKVGQLLETDPIFFEHKPTVREIIVYIGELVLAKAKESLFQREINLDKYKMLGIKD